MSKFHGRSTAITRHLVGNSRYRLPPPRLINDHRMGEIVIYNFDWEIELVISRNYSIDDSYPKNLFLRRKWFYLSKFNSNEEVEISDFFLYLFMCTAFVKLGSSLYKQLTSLSKIYILLFLLLYSIQVNSSDSLSNHKFIRREGILMRKIERSYCDVIIMFIRFSFDTIISGREKIYRAKTLKSFVDSVSGFWVKN